MAHPIRTPDEIARLKAEWESDPEWDIEVTEGFEAHAVELKAHRLACERRWNDERAAEFSAYLEEIGCFENSKLGAHIKWLQRRIEHLEDRPYR